MSKEPDKTRVKYVSYMVKVEVVAVVPADTSYEALSDIARIFDNKQLTIKHSFDTDRIERIIKDSTGQDNGLCYHRPFELNGWHVIDPSQVDKSKNK